MQFIETTYVGNFIEKQILFDVFDEVNRYFTNNNIDIRLIYIGPLKLAPGYLININTTKGKLRAYPLEALIETLYSRLLQDIKEISDESDEKIIMNKILALTTFPIISRNPYFDFYEKFLGYHETITNLRIMILSTEPFRSEDKEKFKTRLFKGILHEIGHAFGLEHCNDECVMNPPKTIEEWDLRPSTYCDRCFLELKRNVEYSYTHEF
ncbi:matrixin family metalloprotease [Thermococcus sp.]